MKQFLCLCMGLLLLPSSLFAAIITVGPGASAGLPTRDYTTICAAIAAATATTADNGDTIEVDSSTSGGSQIVYLNEGCSFAKSVTIKKAPSPPSTLRPALDSTTAVYNGQGYLLPSAGYFVMEDIEGRGARCNNNCQPVWISSVTVQATFRRVYFHDNDNGLLTPNENISSELRQQNILVEHSEFAYNGRWDGQTHNVYFGSLDEATFRYNYSHDSNGGQLLKSRAGINYILYNRLVDSIPSGYATGRGCSNYETDFSSGGRVFYIGNTVHQPAQLCPPGRPAVNTTMLTFCTEESQCATSNNIYRQLFIAHNTFVNRHASGVMIRYFGNPTDVVIKNNIFAGAGDPIMNVSTPVSVPSSNLHNATVSAIGFVAPDGLDFRLNAGSGAVDAATSQGVYPVGGGANSMSIDPTLQYAHPRLSISRTTVGAALDYGPFERTLAGTAYTDPVLAETKTGQSNATVFFGAAAVEGTTITGYRVDRDGSELATKAATDTSHVDSTATPGTTYTYTVVPLASPNGATSNAALGGRQRTAAATIGAESGWHHVSSSFPNICSPAGNCSTYWSVVGAGAAIDNANHHYYLWGVGFGTRNTNEVYRIDLTASQPVWARLNTTDTMATGEYASGGTRPGSRSVYGGLTWLATQGQLMAYGGFLNTAAYSARSWRFTPGDPGTWTDHANGFDLTLDLGSLVYNPNNSKAYVLAGTDLYEYTPGTNTYVSVKSGLSWVQYFGWMVYAPSINKFYVFGPGITKIVDPANSYVVTDALDVSCGALRVLSYPAVDWSTAEGKFIYWDKAQTVTKLDPATNTCTTHNFVGEPILGAGGFPAKGFLYSTALNAFVVGINDGNFAVLRTTGEAAPGTTSGTLRGASRFRGIGRIR